MFHLISRCDTWSTLARGTAFLLCALVLTFAASCVDTESTPSPTPTSTAVATAVIGDPLVDEWATSVCLAINDVSPNLRAAINDDDPQDALADRKQRLNDLRATYRDELGVLTRTLDAIDAPSPMRSFHAQLIDMYRSAATELNAAAPQWRAAQTAEEFDAVRIAIYRQIELEAPRSGGRRAYHRGALRRDRGGASPRILVVKMGRLTASLKAPIVSATTSTSDGPMETLDGLTSDLAPLATSASV